MHEDLHKLHHFNYFTIDFNEEFSGLYGGVLYTQSDFVVAALEAIQQLYSEPKKVIQSKILIDQFELKYNTKSVSSYF